MALKAFHNSTMSICKIDIVLKFNLYVEKTFVSVILKIQIA